MEVQGPPAVPLDSMLEEASKLSRGLDTLKARNEELFNGLSDDNSRRRSDLSMSVTQEKKGQLENSMKKLTVSISEAKLMFALASYLSELEAERHKLKAQVRRLCEENNWLRKELEESQQQLQECEVNLAQVKEEKEALEFQVSLVKDDIHGHQESQEAIPSDLFFDASEDLRPETSRETAAMSSQGPRDESRGGVLTSETAEKLRTLHSRVMQYIHQGRHEVATALCKQLSREVQSDTGSEHQDLAIVLSIQAVVYKDQGKYGDAIQCLKEALAVREKTDPDNKQALAAILNNLAVVHSKTSNFKDAEMYCKRALEIRQKILGMNHPDVAKQLNNLAALCMNLGKYDEVEWHYQRALEIYQTELGPDNTNVSRTKNLLANCYLKQGKYKAAEHLFKEILDKATTLELREAETPTNPQSMGDSQNMWMFDGSGSPGQERRNQPANGIKEAGTYSEQGEWHRSDRVLKPTVTDTLKNLSDVLKRQGKNDAATVLAQFATTSRKGLDAKQKEEVDKVLLDQAGKKGREFVDGDDEDDRNSVSSQPPRSPSPKTSGRPSPALSRSSNTRRSISQSIKKLFGFKQPGGMKVGTDDLDGSVASENLGDSPSVRQRTSLSPMRGIRDTTPKKTNQNS